MPDQPTLPEDFPVGLVDAAGVPEPVADTPLPVEPKPDDGEPDIA